MSSEHVAPPATVQPLPDSTRLALRRVKESYNTAIVGWRKRINKVRKGADDFEDVDLLPPPEAPPEPRYCTGFGQLTFEELHDRTRRIAGNTLRGAHGMTNPEDIDDCLQSAYFKIWKKLQSRPDLFADKPKRYVVTAVVMYSKAQRYAHQRHYRKMMYDADPEWRPQKQTLNRSRVDTWIDLERAILTATVLAGQDSTAHLGLYAALTQVSVSEMVRTFPQGRKLIDRAKHQARAGMASQLAGYGAIDPKLRSFMEALPQPLSDIPKTQPASVADLLGVTGWQGWSVAPSSASQTVWQPNTTPWQPELSYQPAQVALACAEQIFTGWGGWLTLDQVLEDPQLRRAAFAKGYQLGLSSDDIEDCFQQGRVKLWQTLQQQPDLLVDKNPVWAGIYTLFSGDPKKTTRHHKRIQRFNDPDFDWDAADEHLSLGKQSIGRGRWVEAIDRQLDLQTLMHHMATLYEEQPRKLFALYALTTSVHIKHIEHLLGIHPRGAFKRRLGDRVHSEFYEVARQQLQEAPALQGHHFRELDERC